MSDYLDHGRLSLVEEIRRLQDIIKRAKVAASIGHVAAMGDDHGEVLDLGALSARRPIRAILEEA